MKLLTIIVSLCALISTAHASMNGTNYTARTGAPDRTQFYANGGKDRALPGITFLRPVLTGVLYRSGVGGSHKGLSNGQLNALCDAGFSTALIVDFKDKRTSSSCVNYQRVLSRKSAEAGLEAIYQAIITNSGPVLAHCRNGVHASNTLSAKALVRFCGWSIPEAKAYWERTRNNAGCSGGCANWINNKFKGFKEGDQGMRLTDRQKSEICPPRGF